jgi:hypothetical protein
VVANIAGVKVTLPMAVAAGSEVAKWTVPL